MSEGSRNVRLDLSDLPTCQVFLDFRDMDVTVDLASDGSVEISAQDVSGGNLRASHIRQLTPSSFGIMLIPRED